MIGLLALLSEYVAANYDYGVDVERWAIEHGRKPRKRFPKLDSCDDDRYWQLAAMAEQSYEQIVEASELVNRLRAEVETKRTRSFQDSLVLLVGERAKPSMDELWELHWTEMQKGGFTHRDIARTWKREHPQDERTVAQLTRRSANEAVKRAKSAKP